MESMATPVERPHILDRHAGGALVNALVEWFSRHALHVAFGFYCFVGLAFVVFANSNRDEGWYLYASRLVYEGQIPYKDFPYFQMPLLPYVYGLPQLLFGSSLLVGRLTSFALSLITIGVGMHLARRFGGRMAAILFVVLAVVNLHAMWTFTATRTEPLVTPLAMLSLFFLLRPGRSTRDLVLASSFMLWAAAVRLTIAPAFVAVLVFCLYQVRQDRRRWASVATLVGLQALLLIAVPFALSPGRMMFDVWTAQAYRGAQFFEMSNPLGAELRDKALFLPTLMSWYPATVVLTVGVAILLAVHWRGGWRPSVEGLGTWPTAHLMMLALVALLFLPHLALNRIDEYYFVPAFPIAALLGASVATQLTDAGEHSPGHLLLSSLVASLVLVEAFAFAWEFPHYLDTTNPELHQLQNVGAYLKSVVPPDKRILAYDTSVVFEADRRVNDGLEMELFSYWPRLDTTEARRDGVVNYEMLQEMGDDEETGAIVMTTWDELRTLATSSEGPGYMYLTGGTEFAAIEFEKGRYRLVKEYPHLGGFNDSIYIYLRDD